ncbi:putative membrane protein [Arcobacter venerupis]|uniref:Membrane protein n=2 Tax=Arcobacter venerupis TaxID=1054033 RepID=A0AAE7BCP8_9BACT|nr:hypothetical protein [Arcobacter venerupis]QKF67984.1 putative membrane protein [Arcobacter venerupis]RWS48303.1 hypothetical protein CKA56_14725 [Arcobacter venerupis]
MPSFEFVIPQSFLFIPANLSFISSCFFISYILSKIFKSAIIFFILLISMLSIAYYDLFIKYFIKQYYELTQMDSKIYFYPQKNEGQKIDSLSLVNIYNHPLKYSTTLTSIEKDEIRNVHENYIEKFIDISTYAYKYNRTISSIQRVSLNNHDENLEEKARFTIERNLKTTFFPKLYGKYEYKFIDTKTNYILATAFNIFFNVDNNKFRNKYLYWGNEKEQEFNQIPINNFDNIYKQLFIEDLRKNNK